MCKRLLLYLLMLTFGASLFAAITPKAIYPPDFYDQMMVEDGIMVILQELDPYNAMMKVYDSADPANPELLSSMEIPYRSGYRPRLRNSHVYILLPHSGRVDCYSLLDPADPVLVFAYAYYMYDSRDIAFSGDYLLVSTQNGGLRVIDNSDYGNPVEVGSFEDGNQLPRVWAYGTVALVLSFHADSGVSELKVLDITLPEYPNYTGSIELSGYGQNDPLDLSFYHDSQELYLYVSHNLDYLWPHTRVFNFDGVNIPTQIGALNESFSYMAFHEGFGMSLVSMKFAVHDMADPLQPVMLASFGNLGIYENQAMAIDYPFVYAIGIVAHCFDVSNLDPFDLYTDSIDTGISGGSVWGNEALLYNSDAIIGLNVDGTFMEPIFCPDLAQASILALNDEFMYAFGPSSSNHNGSLWSLTNPLNPELMSTFFTSEAKAFLIDGYLLIEEYATANLTLIYDISIPTAPALVSSLTGRFTAAIRQGNTLWLAHHTGLQTYDFADPANPVLISSTSWNKMALATLKMAYREGLLYVGGFREELRIYDVSDPHNPLYTGHVHMPFSYDAVRSTPIFTSDGHLLLNTLMSNHLVLYSLTDPAAPEYVAHHALPFSFNVGHCYADQVYYKYGAMLYALPLPGHTSTDDPVQSPLPRLVCGPNPFTHKTTIRVDLSNHQGKALHKPELTVYNLKGQRVRSLGLSAQAPGWQEQSWDGLDDQGMRCSTGIYLLRLSDRGRNLALGKVILLK
jgi:hypothetical protein